jgi:hypothetical protein
MAAKELTGKKGDEVVIKIQAECLTAARDPHYPLMQWPRNPLDSVRLILQL